MQNNFVFVLHGRGQAWVVDPGESAEVLDFLKTQNLSCQGILITHHHEDHIGGISALVAEHPCPVYAPLKNKKQIPEGTLFLAEGDKLKLADLEAEVLELPGHTLGHIAYWIPTQKWLFSGDVLFALGCGRLFEGSYEQMRHSLERIQALPNESLVFCTHDYFPNNSKFCRQENIPMEGYESIHPLPLSQEKKFNPFLTAPTLEDFTELRKRRNSF